MALKLYDQSQFLIDFLIWVRYLIKKIFGLDDGLKADFKIPINNIQLIKSYNIKQTYDKIIRSHRDVF